MKDLKIYIFIASTLLVLYLVAQYNRPPAVSWAPTLLNKDKIPYGTFILYQQLHDIFPKAKVESFREPVYNVIADHEIKNSNYIIISNDVDLTEEDFTKLSDYVKKGNDVFIASTSFGNYFTKKLKVETSNEGMFNQSANAIRFLNSRLDTTKFYAVDKEINDGYFSGIDTSAAVVLGENRLHHVNFVKYPMGKGALYLNTNPLMFSNYSLLTDQGPGYVATALSFMSNSSGLIWDEYYTSGRDDDMSPMRVFLRNNALRSAYYIALVSLLIFIFYEKKRRQRIIPVIEPLANSTVDFVNVVGQVYYEQRDNNDIAYKKVAYFLENLRAKYNLKTSLLDDDFKRALLNKSGVTPDLIEELVTQIIIVRSNHPVSDRELIDLNKNIEQFYIQSR